MNFKALLNHIKSRGCKVRIYKKKKSVNGSVGTFHIASSGPLISLATKGSSKKKIVEYLLHEFGHFLQWESGYMDTLDSICDSYTIWYEWTTGDIELTPMELQVARNAMLALEYDAELKALYNGKMLRVEHFDPEHHLKGAYAYMLGIKQGWLNRKDFKEAPKRAKLPAKILTKKELFAPLSRQEKCFLNLSRKPNKVK